MLMKTSNLSKNICEKDCPLRCDSQALNSSFEKPSCSISYCSINLNEATSKRIICFAYNSRHYQIIKSNIINNIVPQDSEEGIIYANGYANIKDCCISNNHGQILFYVCSDFQMIIENCTFDDDIKTLEGSIVGEVIGMNWKATSNFIIPIKCTENEKGNCHAEYDIVGSLSPNLSIEELPNDDKCFCYNTCEHNSRYIDSWLELVYLIAISYLPTHPARDIWYDIG